MENQELHEIIKNLDPETKQRFENGELSLDDLKGLGLAEDESYGDMDEEGEEDFQEQYEGESDSDEPSHKKQRTD